ncbi:hypothetical protein Plant_40 [Bacillus phage poppyseed]|uniref:Uncharacterized protein n=5 Tax=Pagevirus TaxID=1921184 RepID=A0A0A0RNW7_9CAUD|nr:hypothetical protein Page_40 [Bacillus phage Page]YP_008771358.1 hypothetical protein Pony_40 [Bacillus phage Pony]YP_009152841.1 hypothetical protein CPT_Pookie42 [Bacillus phage Pookie]YP_009210076.1 hypothetical protein AVV20_gp41 [Bacillus phage Palmer]AGY48057.1 hypothetical protein Plant_40 [Bacillus phage poppyseed]AGY47962.1 hypothetical protein Page_40 [Bacillus phage Page]AGY48281.1 hypothetical protein Pony_40 [Bacillus phage Pony]AIW03727.1 hypothetical protein CPT_Pookie42 [B
MQKCARCGWIHVISVNICNNCKAKFTDEKQFFLANKDILINLALETKDERWFKAILRGSIHDVE